MARKTTIAAAPVSKEKEPDNIEQMAAQAKAERGKRCAEELQAAIKAICQKHNCDSILVVQIGNELRPLAQIFSLPVSLTAIPLDIAPAAAQFEPQPAANGVPTD